MRIRTSKRIFDHSGSSFDSFLDEEGIRGEVEAVAVKRVLAWQLENGRRKLGKTKQAMARELHTSRSQLDRLDRKSTRLNSSHVKISYAVFCLKKKKKKKNSTNTTKKKKHTIHPT